jgi:hypothetical protein
MNSTLERLKEMDFLIRLIPVATSQALYAFLKDQPEVQDAASMIPFISFDDLTAFVHSIPVETGKRSSYDATFAALAVALEPHYVHGRANVHPNHQRFAENFLHGLVALKISELPLAPAVAKIVMNNKYGPIN